LRLIRWIDARDRQAGLQIGQPNELSRRDRLQSEILIGILVQLFRFTQPDPVVQQATTFRSEIVGLLRDLLNMLVHHLDLMLGTIEVESGSKREEQADHRDGSDHEITEVQVPIINLKRVNNAALAWRDV
jgi:hypothetical protein